MKITQHLGFILIACWFNISQNSFAYYLNNTSKYSLHYSITAQSAQMPCALALKEIQTGLLPMGVKIEFEKTSKNKIFTRCLKVEKMESTGNGPPMIATFIGRPNCTISYSAKDAQQPQLILDKACTET